MTRFKVHLSYGGLPSEVLVDANGKGGVAAVIRRECPAARIVEIMPVGRSHATLDGLVGKSSDAE